MNADPRGFWLIYDGKCPVCRSVAHACAIRKIYGTLNLVDARADREHPICLNARAKGLDLDEGMVIFADGSVYHGAGAAAFLATFGEPDSLLTKAGKALNRSGPGAAFAYRILRGLRNLLLRLRGVGQINNLR